MRLIEGFVEDEVTVAVVGANGFVGRGVARLLTARDIRCIEIDQQNENYQASDLLQVRDADIVISATGQPGILDERHLTPYHRLVVDCGYVPIGNEKYGDVARSAATIPQNITPVPGGAGPIEMAILMERIVYKEIDRDLRPWRLQDFQTINYYDRASLQQQQQVWASEIYPIARELMVLKQNELEEISPGVVKLTGQSNYNLVLDSTAGCLSIQGKSNRGELARFSQRGDQVYSATGLTGQDRSNWQTIAQTIPSLRRQQNRDLER